MKSDVQAQGLLTAVGADDWSAPEVCALRPVQGELVREDGLVLRGQACFIPRALRSEFLEHLHRSHLSLEAMQRRVRGNLFWPGIDNDVKVMVENCEACQKFNVSQTQEPLITGEISRHPFEIVHQDLFYWGNREYLVTVDGYSDFFDVTLLGKTSTAAGIIAT